MPRSPVFLSAAVVLAVGLGAGLAAALVRRGSVEGGPLIQAESSSENRALAPDPLLDPDPQLGRRMYVRCQACHGLDGAGIAGNYPPLIKSPMLSAADPTAAIRLLLIGVLRSEHWNGYMPPFAEQLDDRELAAVLTYARGKWGGQAKEITAAEVAAVRGRR